MVCFHLNCKSKLERTNISNATLFTLQLSLRFRGEKTAKVILDDLSNCKQKLVKSLSDSRLDAGLTEPEASILVQSDEDLLNLLNVYCCVNGHNDSDYIERISSGVGFSKNGDCLAKSFFSANEEASAKRPALEDRSSSSDSEIEEEKPFYFYDESSNVDSDEMEADQNENQSELDSFDSDQEMNGEQCDEYSDEDDFSGEVSLF